MCNSIQQSFSCVVIIWAIESARHVIHALPPSMRVISGKKLNRRRRERQRNENIAMGLGVEGGECDPSGFDPQGRWTCVATIDGGPIKKIIGRGRMQSPPRCTKDAALSAAEKWRRQGKARKCFCGPLFLHRSNVDGCRIE